MINTVSKISDAIIAVFSVSHSKCFSNRNQVYDAQIPLNHDYIGKRFYHVEESVLPSAPDNRYNTMDNRCILNNNYPY